jgi:hypothetical protein
MGWLLRFRLCGNSEPEEASMKYIQPQITGVLKADKAIQGLMKGDIPADQSGQPTVSAGYKSDE